MNRDGSGARAVSAPALLLAAGIVIVALLAVLAVDRFSYAGPAQARHASVSATPSSGLPAVSVGALPPEGVAMLAVIDRGGPYRYAQDGTVFGNYEDLLPHRPRGYYHEYTVTTPGSPDRGARRLIVGQLGDVYYTNDHYRSFRQVIR